MRRDSDNHNVPEDRIAVACSAAFAVGDFASVMRLFTQRSVFSKNSVDSCTQRSYDSIRAGSNLKRLETDGHLARQHALRVPNHPASLSPYRYNGTDEHGGQLERRPYLVAFAQGLVACT